MSNIFLQGVPYTQLLDDLRALVRFEFASQQRVVDPPNEAEKLVPISTACAELGVSKQTIHLWKRKGIIPYHKIGHRLFFKLSELRSSAQRQLRSRKSTNPR